ncbi:hypothetical protein BCR34DRAFT_234139 [Clohesyomyces aquaticus]|uniref:BHLH domain-containing protein n=1 Tax=Clohesyomyces aquaticus TaxID=1231657 RepID=A0A1Y1ZW35_9PLEO|nr:hypothetical protein BCR34DRAFT_234139 [Clohesyomyces aquaticus]
MASNQPNNVPDDGLELERVAVGPYCVFDDFKRPPSPNKSSHQTPAESPRPNKAQMDDPTSLPGRVPFTFGGNIDQPPAFHYDSSTLTGGTLTGGTLSSPSVGDGQRQSGFYSPPVWEPNQGGENPMFSPSRYEQTGLPNVQMPPISTPSLHHSPNSLHNGRTSSSSPQTSPEPGSSGNPKKRKSTTEDPETAPDGKKDKQPPVKKTAHNMIEKRYRTNLNDKIAALRDSVPSLRVMSRGNGQGEEEDDAEDLEGLTPAHKLNKATVLSKATEYIRHLEKRNKRLSDEVSTLKNRLESYEKLAISGPMSLPGPVSTPDGSRYTDDPFAPPGMMGGSASGPPQGMIPVPESMANLHRGLPPQPHYAPQHGAYPTYTSGPPRPGLSGPPLVNGRRGNGMMGKLMVGSLAGLMVMEGFATQEKSAEEPAGRGLFALPINLTTYLMRPISFGGVTAPFPLAKLLLIFGAVFYIIAPLLDFKAKPKKKSVPAITLSAAPSLASPVEVRRKAWLTAIQTVWVPRHNFLLEVAALGLKTLKLSTRKVIGWESYALLTNITKDQEAARIKAWDIALDALLAGGDAEISKSRLVLTLMASGTLPDTPARLMLKALHIRVLLWEVANAGYGTWWMFDEICAKLSRRYWNLARSEQKIAAALASTPNREVEPLSEHLAALLDMECADVLVPSIIQRAYNLAWNRPSAENTTLDESMDSVVEDFTITSPLDALAAWWSSYTLKKGLAGYVGSSRQTLNESVERSLTLAARTAPPLSQSQSRALAAQALLLDADRTTHLNKALEVLPSTSSSTPRPNDKNTARALLNLVRDSPVAVDVRNSLTLAKCLVLAETSSDEARRQAIFVINNTSYSEVTTTLLSFVAGYKTLHRFLEDPTLLSESGQGLERLAKSLHLWVRHGTGRLGGLPKKARGQAVTFLVAASTKLVGLPAPGEIDDGYVSQSDTDA